MRRFAVALFLASIPGLAAADVTKEQVKKMKAAGVSDEAMVYYIRANSPAARLSADDVVDLHQAGVSDTVIQAMMARPESSSAPTVVLDPTNRYVYIYFHSPEVCVVTSVRSYLNHPSPCYFTPEEASATSIGVAPPHGSYPIVMPSASPFGWSLRYISRRPRR